jgi:2-hydroxycyclohexanecarboxyl-CoA dehydrogenase
MNRVEGKVVLITGGGSGIGAATGELVCAEGGKVLLVDANAAALASTTRAIVDQIPGARVATFVADVAQAPEAARAVERARGVWSTRRSGEQRLDAQLFRDR